MWCGLSVVTAGLRLSVVSAGGGAKCGDCWFEAECGYC